MPGHAAGDRMDPVADVDAMRSQGLGELDQFMLRLGGGEAVARYDYDLAGVGELQRGVVDGDFADGFSARRGQAKSGVEPSPSVTIDDSCSTGSNSRQRQMPGGRQTMSSRRTALAMAGRS